MWIDKCGFWLILFFLKKKQKCFWLILTCILHVYMQETRWCFCYWIWQSSSGSYWPSSLSWQLPNSTNEASLQCIEKIENTVVRTCNLVCMSPLQVFKLMHTTHGGPSLFYNRLGNWVIALHCWSGALVAVSICCPVYHAWGKEAELLKNKQTMYTKLNPLYMIRVYS